MNTLKILHVITGLELGGAERMLHRLLAHATPCDGTRAVVSLIAPGPMAAPIEALGIPVHSLNMRRGLPGVAGWWRLRTLVREFDAQLVVAWMYHANLMSRLAVPAGGPPVIWGVRQSLSATGEERWSTRAAIRAGAWLSAHATRIVYNSDTSRRQHEASGFAADKSIVIANGFDTTLFRPQPALRGPLRHTLGIPAGRIVVGHVARYHPMKDHAGLLAAAAVCLSRNQNMHFVLAGSGVDVGNAELMQHVAAHGLENHVSLLGPRNDIERILPALDIVVQSSASREGLPNAIGEAMACGIPCVATDVGDSRVLMGDSGLCVPPRDPHALAGALCRLATTDAADRTARGQAARKRIIAHYGMQACVAGFENLMKEVAGERNSGS
ncbi:MAG: glycosyltransferase [Gammaproteobacteria bacterium]|nr:glycosyltransferase [Gammaproteobacteria bacterium]